MTTETKWCDRDFPHPSHNWIDHSNDEYGISGVYQCPGIVENLTKPIKVDNPAVAQRIIDSVAMQDALDALTPDCRCGCRPSDHTVDVDGEAIGCVNHVTCSVYRPQSAKVEADPTVDERRRELQDWWVTRADDEVGMVASKALEYGGGGAAIDLIEIGRNLVMSGAGGHVNGIHQLPDDARLAELGVYFYLVGKMARWTAAVIEGRQVSDDTLLDIGIYVRMVQRIRDAGGWPNG